MRAGDGAWSFDGCTPNEIVASRGAVSAGLRVRRWSFIPGQPYVQRRRETVKSSALADMVTLRFKVGFRDRDQTAVKQKDAEAGVGRVRLARRRKDRAKKIHVAESVDPRRPNTRKMPTSPVKTPELFKGWITSRADFSAVVRDDRRVPQDRGRAC